MTVTVAERRVKKELQKLRKDPLDGMTVEVGDVPTEWFVTIVGESDVLSTCLLVGFGAFLRAVAVSSSLELMFPW